MSRSTRFNQRRGLTLVELLTVIGVIVILLAIAIPLMRFDIEDRHIREASRGVNAYIVAAQSRAAERNRAVGVWIERRDGSPSESIRLYTAEVPPPYIGDTSDARASIQLPQNGNFQVAFPRQLSTLIPALIAQGDVIRFDYKGPYYRITNDPSQTPPTQPVVVFRLDGQAPPSAVNTELPFQILRQPVKSGVSNLELPRTASIDLNLSGFGAVDGLNRFAPANQNDTSPVVIMFSPSGRVDHVRVRNTIVVPQETLHLLIGRDERIDLAAPAQNLDELTNLWVSVGAQTGSTSTAEIAKSDTANTIQQRLVTARKFANRKHQMGGG